MIITSTTELAKDLMRLPVEKDLIVVDESDNEYVIDAIVKRKTYSDDINSEWRYALKVRECEGRIKR